MARAVRLKRERPESSGWKWWQGMLGGMLLMLAPGAAMLLTVLFAPSVLVVIADTTPRRSLTRSVMLFSVAGAIEPVRIFIATGHDIDAGLALLAHPATVLFVWLCAASGWLLNELFCLVATVAVSLKLAARRKAGDALLLEMRAEWELPDDQAAS